METCSTQQVNGKCTQKFGLKFSRKTDMEGRLILNEFLTKAWTKFNWFRIGSNSDLSYAHSEKSGFHKSRELLDHLNIYQFFKKGFLSY